MALATLILGGFTGLPAAEENETGPGGDFTPPVPIHRVSPRHPPELMAQLINGSASVECAIEADGSVKSVKLLSATHQEFGLAALDAVREWTFEPARRDGQPVAVNLHIPFDFKMTNEQVVEMAVKRPVYQEIPDLIIAAQEMPAWPTPRAVVLPRYPNSLVGTGKYGKAVVSIVINKEGQVMNPRIVKATYPEFILPALVTAARLRFRPQVMANGERIHVSMEIQFDFVSPDGRRRSNAVTTRIEKKPK